MNKQATVAAVLSLAAASGVAAGTLIHRASATPAAQRTTGTATLPTTPSTTPPPSTTPTNTAPASTTATTPATTPATTLAPPTTPPPTSVTVVKPTPEDLLGRGDFELAGLANVDLAESWNFEPLGSMSSCPNPQHPGSVDEIGRGITGRYGRPGGSTSGYQLVVDARSEADAESLVRFARDWYADCGTPAANAPRQDFEVGVLHEWQIEGADVALWWDTTFTDDGKAFMETVAVVRSDRRVSILVFTDLDATIRDTRMTPLMTTMTAKMAP